MEEVDIDDDKWKRKKMVCLDPSVVFGCKSSLGMVEWVCKWSGNDWMY